MYHNPFDCYQGGCYNTSHEKDSLTSRISPGHRLRNECPGAMFSIITLFNNKEILQEYLLDSLHNQSVDYELILIDNTSSRFSSYPEALHYGLTQIKSQSRYVMFVHQDIRLEDSNFLKDTEIMLDSIPNLGVAGVAGAVGKEYQTMEVLSNIYHGTPPTRAGNRRVTEPEKIDTVDGCLVFVPRCILSRIPFDDKTCDGFHHCIIDYCLTVKNRGYDVYVIPSVVYHLSTGQKPHFSILSFFRPGNYPDDYYRTLNKVLKKYRKQHKVIFTTCGVWSTAYPASLQYMYYMKNIFVYGLARLRKRFSRR